MVLNTFYYLFMKNLRNAFMERTNFGFYFMKNLRNYLIIFLMCSTNLNFFH